MKSVYLKNLLISLIILSAWTAVIAFIGSRSQTSLDYGITLFTGLWLLRIASIGGAALMFALRILPPRIRRQSNFFYFLFATSNFLLGIFGLLLFARNKLNEIPLHTLLPNLLIGTLLFADIFFFDLIFNKSDPPEHS